MHIRDTTFSFTRRNTVKAAFITAMLMPLLLIPGVKIMGFFALAVSANLLFSFFARPIRRFSLGIELTTVLTVICALAFGPLWGAIFGVGLILAEYAGTMRLSALAIVTVPSVAAMGAIAPLFSSVDIATLGLMMTIGYNAVTVSLCFFIRHRMAGLLMFAVTNIVWNNVVFSLIGAIV